MEYYGEKPKKFTKEWWPYFWDYYKWHTIVIIAVVILIAVTAFEVINQEKYDGSVVTVGKIAFSDETKENFEKELSKISLDTDNNGEKNILLEQLLFSEIKSDTDAQYAMAMQTKYDLKLQTDESFAFLIDKEQLEATVARDDTQGCFVPVEDWVSKEVPQEDILVYNGVNYGVSLKNSKILKDLGIPGDNVYAVLRNNYKPQDEKLNLQFENAKNILNELIKSE